MFITIVICVFLICVTIHDILVYKYEAEAKHRVIQLTCPNCHTEWEENL